MARTDFELVEAFRAGDTGAGDELVRRHLGRVRNLVFQLVLNHDVADDLTQEAFAQALRGLPGFRGQASFSTWLHRIAVNVVLRTRRRLSAAVETDVEADVAQASSGEWHLDTPVEESEIEQAIAGLPDGARDVLVLVGIYGYSHQETAEMLGVAEGTCKAQLHRARRLLQHRLNMEIR